MDRLPHELILLILQNLLPGRELQNMRAVSQRFRDAIDNDARLQYRQLCASLGIHERAQTDYSGALQRLQHRQASLDACFFETTTSVPLCSTETIPGQCAPIRVNDKIYVASTMQELDRLGHGIAVYQRSRGGYQLMERRDIREPFLHWVSDVAENLLVLCSRIE